MGQIGAYSSAVEIVSGNARITRALLILRVAGLAPMSSEEKARYDGNCRQGRTRVGDPRSLHSIQRKICEPCTQAIGKRQDKTGFADGLSRAEGTVTLRRPSVFFSHRADICKTSTHAMTFQLKLIVPRPYRFQARDQQ